LALLPIFSSTWPLILLPGLVAFHEVIIDPACSVVFEEESADPKVMQEKPRSTKSKIFTKAELLLSSAQGFAVFFFILLLFLHLENSGRGEQEIRSITFGTLMIANIGLILTNRSRTLTILQTFRQRQNYTVKWIMGLAVVVLVSLLSLAPLRTLFDLGAITLFDWLLMLSCAGLAISWYEVFKFIKNRKLNSH
jgi:Ca2+-transporting ATPase